MSLAFDLEVCRRLPLADASLRLLDFVTEDDFLNGVYARHRGRSYERAISFPLLVRLVADALVGHRGASAHQTFQQARADEALPASPQAAYAKLRRLPLEVSTGFFAEAAARLRDVAAAVVANPLPASLAAFWALGFDGKKLKYVAKRLKVLRGLRGHVFGGKLLVVQDLATQQAVVAEASADGEAGDNPLVPPAVGRVRALPGGRDRLWFGDAAFCDYQLLGLLSAGGDHFVVRFNTSCAFYPDPGVPARAGEDDQGRPYREEGGWLGRPGHPHRIRVRKVTVTGAAGSRPLILVTSLLDAGLYPAVDLLTAYRSRWGLEVMFQQVVQTFDLRHLIGGTPRATVFQAMLCLLLYNVTLTLRDYVASGAGREPKEVSLGRLFDHAVRDLTGWMEVLGSAATLELLRATRAGGTAELRRYLEATLGAIWTDRWEKAPTRKRPPRPRPRAYLCGGHSSVEKILRGEHKEIPLHPGEPKKGRAPTDTPPPYEAKKDV
jgi:Transposase DDE domain